MKDVMIALGALVQIQTKHRMANYGFGKGFITSMLEKGSVTLGHKYEEDNEHGLKHLNSLKEFASDCRMVGLDVIEDENGTEREHGYHSGSWDVRAYKVTVSFPPSPAMEVLFGKG